MRLLYVLVIWHAVAGCGSAGTPAGAPTVSLPATTAAVPAMPASTPAPPAPSPDVATPVAKSPTVGPTSVPAWSEVTAVGAGSPAPRYDHSVLVDPVRNMLVVFGGRGSGNFGDTWVFDLTTRAWREVKGDSPAARFGHAVVLDAAGRRMVLVMGEGDTFYNDAWAFDLDQEKWTQLSASGAGDEKPRPRYGQSAALDARGWVVISHGFSDQGRFDDTWAFDLKTNHWINLTPASGAKPLKRCLHELVYDTVGDRVLLFGGCSSGFGPCPQGDLWAFDLKANAWIELKPAGAKPSARDNPSLIYDPVGKRAILFGGRAENGVSAETWAYEVAANQWVQLSAGTGPDARRSHDSGFDANGARMLVFGGSAADGPRSDIWEWK